MNDVLFDGETANISWTGVLDYETYILTSHRVIIRRHKDYLSVPYKRIKGFDMWNVSNNQYNITFYGFARDSKFYVLNLSENDAKEFIKSLAYYTCS